jgi:hypothetical protein
MGHASLFTLYYRIAACQKTVLRWQISNDHPMQMQQFNESLPLKKWGYAAMHVSPNGSVA